MRRTAATPLLIGAIAIAAGVGAFRSAAAAGRQADRFAGLPATAGFDATVARFVPVPSAFSATLEAAHPVRGDRFFLAYDANGQAPSGSFRPWVLTLALGRGLLPAVRTVDRRQATLVVALGRQAAPPGATAWSDPAGSFTITRVARVAG